MLTLDKIYHAAFVLKDVARKTDLIEAPKLSKDCQLYLKTENLASSPARQATTHRAWRWPLPAGVSGASSVCRTAHPL